MANGFTDEQVETLKELMKTSTKEVLEEEEVVTKKDISHLPTKEEFYSSQDKLMGELKTSREEQAAHMHLHDNLEKRVSKLEKQVNLN